MKSKNYVSLIGNCGSDPRIGTLPDGAKAAQLSLATSHVWIDRETEEKHEQTEWHRLVFYRGLAEVVEKYVKKGNPIAIDGHLRNRKYTDRDGIDRYTTEIVVDDLIMLQQRAGEGVDRSTPPAAAPEPAPAAPAAGKTASKSRKAAAPERQPEPDDVPF